MITNYQKNLIGQSRTKHLAVFGVGQSRIGRPRKKNLAGEPELWLSLAKSTLAHFFQKKEQNNKKTQKNKHGAQNFALIFRFMVLDHKLSVAVLTTQHNTTTWLEVLVEASKESDYTEKHQHTLPDRVFRGVQVRPRVWKRFRDPQGSDSGLPGAKFLRVHQEAGGHDPGFARVGIGWGRGIARAHVSRFLHEE